MRYTERRQLSKLANPHNSTVHLELNIWFLSVLVVVYHGDGGGEVATRGSLAQTQPLTATLCAAASLFALRPDRCSESAATPKRRARPQIRTCTSDAHTSIYCVVFRHNTRPQRFHKTKTPTKLFLYQLKNLKFFFAFYWNCLQGQVSSSQQKRYLEVCLSVAVSHISVLKLSAVKIAFIYTGAEVRNCHIQQVSGNDMNKKCLLLGSWFANTPKRKCT